MLAQLKVEEEEVEEEEEEDEEMTDHMKNGTEEEEEEEDQYFSDSWDIWNVCLSSFMTTLTHRPALWESDRRFAVDVTPHPFAAQSTSQPASAENSHYKDFIKRVGYITLQTAYTYIYDSDIHSSNQTCSACWIQTWLILLPYNHTVQQAKHS